MTLNPFLIFLAATGAAAATGMIFKPGDWYDTLKKPGFTPPKWAFPVVWTLLYLTIALAAARIAGLAGSGTALALWSLQIALNTLWTPVFFGAQRVFAGLIIILLLWLTVAMMLVAFWALDFWAAVLVLPYLAWLSIAAALNLSIWRHNRGAAV